MKKYYVYFDKCINDTDGKIDSEDGELEEILAEDDNELKKKLIAMADDDFYENNEVDRIIVFEASPTIFDVEGLNDEYEYKRLKEKLGK